MSRPQHIEDAISRAYRIESLLRILSMAVDGEQISGTTFTLSGGGAILDTAADMVGELAEALEVFCGCRP